MINSLKRSGNKTKDVVGKIAKNKLEKVLTGKGRARGKKRNKERKKRKKNKLTLLDD